MQNKKKNKSPIYIRYEFSDEAGRPEGADILEIASMKKVQDLAVEILKVAHSDGVSVNITVGEKKPFFAYLKDSGISVAAAEKEMIDTELKAEPSKKKTKKKNRQ